MAKVAKVNQEYNVVGELYEIVQQDFVIDLALAVSRDFMARPAAFGRQIVREDAGVLVGYAGRRDTLTADERRLMAGALVGWPEWGPRAASSAFADTRNHLFKACDDLARSTATDASTVLESAIVSEVAAMRDQILMIGSSSYGVALERLRADGIAASDALRVAGGAYGAGAVPGNFPLGVQDVPFLCNAAQGTNACRDVLSTAERATTVLRAGQRGKVALTLVLTCGDVDNEVDELATALLAWSRELRKLGVGV